MKRTLATAAALTSAAALVNSSTGFSLPPLAQRCSSGGSLAPLRTPSHAGGAAQLVCLDQSAALSRPWPSRRDVMRMLPALVAAGVPGSAFTALAAPAGASVIPRALQGLTDECETDACIGKARRVFRRAGRRLEISQEFGTAQSRSTGSAVWEGDVVLTKYMETELPKDYWKGKKVLELGAGTGFASFVAALLGASCVITDGDSRVLELAKSNAAVNLTPEEQALLQYSQLKWERAADPAWKYEKGDSWDVILAADVTYYSKNIPPLTRMMQRLAGPKTEIFLAHTIRPTDGDSMESFKKYFQVEKITTGPSFEGHQDTFLYRMTAKPGAGDGGAVEVRVCVCVCVCVCACVCERERERVCVSVVYVCMHIGGEERRLQCRICQEQSC